MSDLDVLSYFKLVGHTGDIVADSSDPGTYPDFVKPTCSVTITPVVSTGNNLILPGHTPPLLLAMHPVNAQILNGTLIFPRGDSDTSSDVQNPGGSIDATPTEGVWLVAQTAALALPDGATLTYNVSFGSFNYGGGNWTYENFSFLAPSEPNTELDIATVDRINTPPSSGNNLIVRAIPDHYVVDNNTQTFQFVDSNGNAMGDPIPFTITGAGDMLAATYDPQDIDADVFDRANQTGSQPASSISDFSAAADARVRAAMITDITSNNNDSTIPTSAAVSTLVNALIAGIVAGVSPNKVTFVGDGVSTDIPVVHNLGTEFVGCTVFRNSSPAKRIFVDYEATDANTITIHNEETWDLDEYVAIVTFLSQSDTVAPNPGALSWSSSTSTSLTYSFSGASDASGISHIDAYDAVTNTLLASNVTSPWTRSSLLASTSYSTYLKVYDNEGNTANTNTVVHSTDAPAGDTIPPTPGVLTTAGFDQTSITYTFTGGSDNVGVVGIDAYDGATNTLIQANVSSPWVRGSLTGNTAYSTFMRYRDAAGNHADSNTRTDTTAAAPSGSITFIDSHGEKTTTALSTMPTHQAGDLLVIIAYRDGFNTPPTVPSGWTDKGSDGVNNNAIRVGYKVAASSSEVSGTWTNSTDIICLSYRGATLIGAVAFGNGLGVNITIPALTLTRGDGSSWVVASIGDRQGGENLNTASGLTTRAVIQGTSSTQDQASYDTNAGVSTFAGSSVTATPSFTIGWESVAIEVKTS